LWFMMIKIVLTVC